MAVPMVLDTDMGSDVDDALCLALALASPELELVGVTSVGREPLVRARVARKLIELAGHDVPVHAGCPRPLLASTGFNWFGHEGDALDPGEEPRVEAEHGADALLRITRERSGVEVVAVGPLTNLAVALAKEPELAGRVARLTVMGGHLRRAEYGGHVFAPGVDYNLCSDPHAAYAVLRAGIPIRLVTADVTLRTWITPGELERIEKADSPLNRALVACVRAWTPEQRRIFSAAGCDVADDNVAFLHDPLALACVHDESFCTFEELAIEVRIDEGVLRTHERGLASDATRPMRCATAVDPEAIRAHFTERVCGLRAPER